MPRTATGKILHRVLRDRDLSVHCLLGRDTLCA